MTSSLTSQMEEVFKMPLGILQFFLSKISSLELFKNLVGFKRSSVFEALTGG